MIDPGLLAAAFERNTGVLVAQVAGLSHEDSLLQVPYRINCLNWTLGHLLDGRGRVLEMMGRDRIVPAADTARYVRESDPILEDGPGVMALDRLVPAIVESGQAIAAELGEVEAAAMEQETEGDGGRRSTLGGRLHFQYFHDTYHTGQTELLRQVTGIGDQVI